MIRVPVPVNCFQMAEVSISRNLFDAILRRIR